MKKLILLFLLLVFVFTPATTSAKIDDLHIKSIVQIKIWDNVKSSYISTGSGVFTDVLNVLTNYHVVEDVINNPDRYLAVACITNNSSSVPDCKYIFSAYGSWSSFPKKPKVIKELDLALLQFREIIINGEIKEFVNLPISDYPNFLSHEQISVSIYGDELTGIGFDDQVQTLGYPAEGGNNITYSNGTVTNFQINKYGRVLKIITSAKIGPGSSGGAAFDSYGKFIGVTSGGYKDSNGNFIAGVIIPVSTINWWLQGVQEYRVNKEGEYTILDEEFEEAIEKAICLIGGDSKDVWDEKNKTCICNSGYFMDSGGACVEGKTSSYIEGALIRATNGIDVYIVKYVGSKKFKRLILSPSVFNNYGHLRWEDVIDVSQDVLDEFTTSELVRAANDHGFYKLYPMGDTGQKRLIKDYNVLAKMGLDPDSIYEINSFDWDSYITGLMLE